MFIDLLVQFIIESIRALLIEGMSDFVRGRAARARRNRRIQLYLRLRAGRLRRPIVRTLSTEDGKKVK
jgi:hypothetical protein